MENKKWDVFSQLDSKVFEQFPEINSIVLQLLSNREIKNSQDIKSFLQPDYSVDLGDPFVFQDMEKAVARIF